MGNIAIIPARGGSKRIPRKNIKHFLGKPIMAYSIEAALKSGIFDTVMVSTDDSEIAEMAMFLGAEVPFFRTNKSSDDFATTVDVLLEVIDMYQKKGQFFDHFCCLYPTAPFVTSQILQIAFDQLINSNLDSLFPVVSFSYPIQRALKIDEHKVNLVWPENENKRSQDLEPRYHDAGLFYFSKTSVLLEKKKLWTENTGSLILSDLQVQDIDNETDWHLAELKFKFINGL